MKTLRLTLALLAAGIVTGACKKAEPTLLYEPVAVVRRDIVVSVEANGSIQPIQIVDVKSRASGTILEMRVETGDMVHRGDTLVKVDRRDPTTTYNQAQADLEVAQAQAANATAQKRRADEMFAAGVLSEQDHENASLSDANARAQLVRAQASLQSALDALTDCNVLAPIDGTILVKNVEAGGVITSAVRDVSGGTVLLRMADLSTVEVQALVDETDIGKVQARMPVVITVDAYPNRQFQGTVLKIEPQSTTSQNVTMFPVLVDIPNPDGLLRPGMNAEVAIQIGQAQNVIAVPSTALRTQRDVASAAAVLGLDPETVERELAAQDSAARANPELASSAGARAPESARRAGRGSGGGAPQAPRASGSGSAGGAPAPGQARGGSSQLPPGVTQEQLSELRRKRMSGETLTAQDSAVQRKLQRWRAQQGGRQELNRGASPQGGLAVSEGGQGAAGSDMQQLRAIFQKQRSGQTLTPQEQALMQQAMRRFRQGGGAGGQAGASHRRFGEGNSYQFGGTYIVFALKDGKPTALQVRTGLTDMDYSAVLSGLAEGDTVLLLPSASLIEQQAEMRARLQRFAGRAVPGMQQSSRSTGGRGR